MFIGIDLGGTTLSAGLVERLEIRCIKTVPTDGKRSAEEILATIIRLISDISRGYSVDGIGIGVPNPAGPDSDRLLIIENLPVLEGFPLKSHIESRFDVPVFLENDALCMTLGEHRAGALRGYGTCACITLGTGLGCGIIIDGRVYRGTSYCAGEIWNIPWADGMILEDSIGIRGIKALHRSLSGNDIEPHVLYGRYCEGDSRAIETFDRYGEAVGRAVVMILSFLDPEKIAIGGGISKSYEAFRKGLFRVVEKTWGIEATEKIIPAELSGKAAILGAAALIEEKIYG